MTRDDVSDTTVSVVALALVVVIAILVAFALRARPEPGLLTVPVDRYEARVGSARTPFVFQDAGADELWRIEDKGYGQYRVVLGPSCARAMLDDPDPNAFLVHCNLDEDP